MRIDQFISQSTPLSRKDVKQAARDKKISINGVVCSNPAIKVSADDVVILNGELIKWPTEEYFMLYKPAGYCCSHDDDGYPSALRLLPSTHKKLHFAGRLDADTTGLVLISSDGQWCHRVTSPKQKVDKCKMKYYRAKLAEPLNQEDINKLEMGIMLHGEDKPTLPAHITPIDNNLCDIAITEGRYHQVKRMFAASGNRVQSLHRYQIADITLDHTLSPGEWRALNTREIEQF